MHTHTLKKLALALTFWIAVYAASLKAQILGPYGTSPYTFGVDSNGLLSDTGNFGTGTLSLSGAGTRMFWYPGKAAFRAGYIDSFSGAVHDWDDSNIGDYSVAFGQDTTASGKWSLAVGTDTTASGDGSFAAGQSSTASQPMSFAIGHGSTASGWGSAAFGQSTASGTLAASFGGSKALADYSTAFGSFSTASGLYSNAFGLLTTASGFGSTSSGYYTLAQSVYSTVVGTFNVGGGSPDTWVSTDPLFEVGNGSGGTASNNYTPIKSDAFVVYKNGNVAAQGVMTVAPGGDIPMYSGN